MAAVGYTTVANVAAYLGLTLTTAQTAEATTLLSPAEAFVNRYTRRVWNPSNIVIVSEQYDLLRDWILLKQIPVVSVQSVFVRTRQIQDPGATLVANVDYELQNAATGLLVLTSGYGDPHTELGVEVTQGYPDTQAPILIGGGQPWAISRTYALVSYTALTPPPDDLSHATTMLVAHWLTYQIDPTRYGISAKRMGQRDLTLATRELPCDLVTSLNLLKRPGVFG